MEMININQLTSHIVVDFDMFARLPPNTSIHLDRNNHFIITAKYLANLKGIQTIANIIKSHTTKQLILDLHNFTETIINILNWLNGKRYVNEMLIICRDFSLAYKGPLDSGGGIIGLLETYKDDSNYRELKNVISFMKESMDFFKNETYKHRVESYNDLCPEVNYNDENWEKAISEIPTFKTEYVGFSKYYIGYSIPLTINQINTNFNKWNEIIIINGISIYLGGLPIVCDLVGRNDCMELIELGIKSVLSTVEIYENNTTGYIYSAITPNEWKNNNIKHYQIPSPDYCGMYVETILKGVEYMHWNITNGRSVYVHCKSGKSRSFVIVICYFVKYLGYNINDAMNFIKNKRIHAGFGVGSKKMDVIKEFVEIINK